MSRIRIVAPWKPFPPEGDVHRLMAEEGFDWHQAIAMMAETAKESCRCPVHLLMDEETPIPVRGIKALRYRTEAQRLMIWTVEVCLRFLESPDFDRNTVMLDIDQLVFGNLRKWFKKRPPDVDLGVLVRPHGKHLDPEFGEPLLNGVQFWHVAGRARLVALYERVLDVAKSLPEIQIEWGGDTDALRAVIEPIEIGIVERAGARVQMWPAGDVLEAWSSMHSEMLEDGLVPSVRHAVLDFRSLRKRYMAAMYQATRDLVSA